MQVDRPDPDSSHDERPRFQFSLRAQMIVVTTLAILFGLFAVLGWPLAWVAFHGVFYCLLPTPLAIGALFARGELRILCIGAFVPWVGTWGQSAPFWMIQYSSQSTAADIAKWMLGSAIYMLVASVACGILAVATHRWLKRQG